MRALSQRSKFLLVAAGYGAAFLLALAAVELQAALTYGPDPQASSGMSAFGDLVLFLGVFAAAATAPSGAALYLLKPFSAFWRALSVISVLVAISGIGATALHAAARTAATNSSLADLAALAMLRTLAAPVFALAFLISGLIAPQRSLAT